MHLISALASGIRGAENGTVRVYRNRTTTPAMWYSDSEGIVPVNSGLPIPLDSWGSAIVYVDQVVDIYAYNAQGTLVRSFSDVVGAGAIRIESEAFTGTDVNGQTGTEKPVSLATVLDRWLVSGGAADWQALVAGENIELKEVLTGLAGLVINVKAAPYNAVGDNTVNDAGAFQAALDAQELTGYPIVVPAGNYRIATNLEIKGNNVLIIGAGSDATTLTLVASDSDQGIIQIVDPTLGARGIGDTIRIKNMGFVLNDPILTSDTAVFFIDTIAKVEVEECKFRLNADDFTCTALWQANGNSTWRFKACEFYYSTGQANAAFNINGSQWHEECTYRFASAISNYTRTQVSAIGGNTFVTGCDFDGSLISGTSGSNSYLSIVGGTSRGVVYGNYFRNPAGGITTVILTAEHVLEGLNGYGDNVELQMSTSTHSTTDTDQNQALSIDSKVAHISSSASGVTLPNAGHVRVSSTFAGAAPQITWPTVIVGQRWTLIWHNDWAGGTHTCSNAGAPVKGATITANTNSLSRYDIVGESHNGGNYWMIATMNASVAE